jgi:hypothetical protein
MFLIIMRLCLTWGMLCSGSLPVLESPASVWYGGENQAAFGELCFGHMTLVVSDLSDEPIG